MPRIHRSFDAAPLIAARALFAHLPDEQRPTDADIIGMALARFAGVPDPPPARDRQRAGQLAGGETTKRKARQKQRQDEAEATYTAYSVEELAEVARTAQGDEQTLRLLATVANLQIALASRQ